MRQQNRRELQKSKSIAEMEEAARMESQWELTTNLCILVDPIRLDGITVRESSQSIHLYRTALSRIHRHYRHWILK